MSAPVEHIQEGVKLTADALVDLYEITLVGAPSPTVICITNGEECVWQGKLYEAHPCKITSISRSTDSERPRPTFSVFNPFGLINAYAFQGYFDGARVIRRRVLRQHIVSNTALSDNQFWYISKVKELLAGQSASFELRMLSDGPEHQIPARMYVPPAFPFVTI